MRVSVLIMCYTVDSFSVASLRGGADPPRVTFYKEHWRNDVERRRLCLVGESGELD